MLASRHEAYPLVLGEAMAAGAAIVATDCPTGPRELIDAKESGVLVPPEDSAALAAAIIALIDAPAERRRLGEAAKIRARRFSGSFVLPAWDDLVARAETGSR